MKSGIDKKIIAIAITKNNVSDALDKFIPPIFYAMTDSQLLQWIKTNLGSTISQAISDCNGASTPYTEPWLGGLTYREVGQLLNRYVPLLQNDVNAISAKMEGDWSQRPGDAAPMYHGYGFTQIDIASWPDFINSGDWKDPYKTYCQCIKDLEIARTYLTNHAPASITDDQDTFNKYIIAAYNCGAGNEIKAIDRNLDPDAYDTNHNYAAAVLSYAAIYAAL